MNILIVEDNEKQMQALELLIKEFFNENNLDYQIHIYDHILDIEEMANGCDIIFLDIEVNGENGIDAALKLRKNNKDIKLIFVSNHKKYLVDGYKAHADRYFLKPINKTEFNVEMKDVLNSYILNNMFIKDDKISKSRVHIREILFIEVLQRKTILHMINKSPLELLYPLSWWQEKLKDAYFSQTHRSFLVNMQNVTSYNSTAVNLINSKNIPLSRTYRMEFEKNYQFYLNVLL